jgi:hypothetical protein
MKNARDTSKQPRHGLRSPGRRLILGGIPIAVTLASKPALAMHAECSVSNALSGNLSHPLPQGVNCGLTSDSWVKLAGTEQLWNRTGFAPSTGFLSACGTSLFGDTWTCGNQSLLAALEGSLTVSCKIGGAAVELNAAAFGAQVAAALLNAACFSPNNFPMSLGQVQGLVAPIWGSHPQSRGLAQSLLNSAASRAATYNINS